MVFVAILAFIVAVVFLVIYVIQMHRTKKEYLGKNAVKQIAEQAAEQALKKETKITCDYCGFVIDTKKYKVCPQCGATYGSDQEWLDRRNVDPAKMDKKFQAGIQKNKNKVKELNARRMKRVIFLVIAISAFIIFTGAVVILALGSRSAERNRSDTVKEGYEKTGYRFTDSTIVDNNDLKVELGDIYVRDDSYSDEKSFSYMIEVRIQNMTGKNGHLTFDVPAANNLCIPEYFYEEIGKKGEFIRFIEIPRYYLGDEYLKKLVLSDIRDMDNKYNEYINIKEPIVFITDAEYDLKPSEPIGEVLYEKNDVVFSLERNEEGDWLYITNIGKENFEIRTYASLVNGEPDRIWIDTPLPAETRDKSDLSFRIHLEEGEILSEAKIQFECKCISAPEKSFVTDYIELPLEQN